MDVNGASPPQSIDRDSSPRRVRRRASTWENLQNKNLEAGASSRAPNERPELVQPPDPRTTSGGARAWKDLDSVDVAALIINKMVGSGIFTGPYLVLVATENKSVAVGLWILGFLYTILSMWLYLEYARNLPYTGGELIYLDYTFSRPRLLAYTIYAFYFVLLYSTATNAMRFGGEVLTAAHPDVGTQDQNQNLLRFIAVVVTTGICLLLYFSDSASRKVNLTTAFAKVFFLLAVLIASAIYVRRHGASTSDWTEYGPGPRNWTAAVLVVFFGFHGWDNGTLVAGYIPRYTRLRDGFYFAVVLVGLLYVAIAVTLCFSFSWADSNSLQALENYLPSIFGGSNAAQVVSAVLVALSAASSNLSVSYTCVRVKQIIGWTNILPLSNLWRRSAPVRTDLRLAEDGRPANAFDEAAARRKGTPEGGIILHWLTTVFFIILSAAWTNHSNGIAFSGSLLIYGHFWVEAFIGGGFLFYDRAPGDAHRIPESDWEAPEAPTWMQPRSWPWVILGFLTAAFCIIIIVFTPRDKIGRPYLYVVLGVIGASILFWFGFVYRRSANCLGRIFRYTMEEKIHGVDDHADPWRQCVHCSPSFHAHLAPHRHRDDGYTAFNSVQFHPGFDH